MIALLGSRVARLDETGLLQAALAVELVENVILAVRSLRFAVWMQLQTLSGVMAQVLHAHVLRRMLIQWWRVRWDHPRLLVVMLGQVL